MKYFKYLIFFTTALSLILLILVVTDNEKKQNTDNHTEEYTKQIQEENKSQEISKKEELRIIKVGGLQFEAEVLDEESERVQGLSGRESLEKDRVMLFVFEKEEYPGIWMKDMNFGIDIAWVDKNGKIIHIEKDVSPKTFPKVFFPPSKSLYVLETNAGFFDHHNFRVGDLVEISF